MCAVFGTWTYTYLYEVERWALSMSVCVCKPNEQGEHEVKHKKKRVATMHKYIVRNMIRREFCRWFHYTHIAHTEATGTESLPLLIL